MFIVASGKQKDKEQSLMGVGIASSCYCWGRDKKKQKKSLRATVEHARQWHALHLH